MAAGHGGQTRKRRPPAAIRSTGLLGGVVTGCKLNGLETNSLAIVPVRQSMCDSSGGVYISHSPMQTSPLVNHLGKILLSDLWCRVKLDSSPNSSLGG